MDMIGIPKDAAGYWRDRAIEAEARAERAERQAAAFERVGWVDELGDFHKGWNEWSYPEVDVLYAFPSASLPVSGEPGKEKP